MDRIVKELFKKKNNNNEQLSDNQLVNNLAQL